MKISQAFCSQSSTLGNTIGRIQLHDWAHTWYRWAASDYDRSPAHRFSAIKVLLTIEEKWEVLSLEVIAESQNKHPPTDEEDLT